MGNLDGLDRVPGAWVLIGRSEPRAYLRGLHAVIAKNSAATIAGEVAIVLDPLSPRQLRKFRRILSLTRDITDQQVRVGWSIDPSHLVVVDRGGNGPSSPTTDVAAMPYPF